MCKIRLKKNIYIYIYFFLFIFYFFFAVGVEPDVTKDIPEIEEGTFCLRFHYIKFVFKNMVKLYLHYNQTIQYVLVFFLKQSHFNFINHLDKTHFKVRDKSLHKSLLTFFSFVCAIPKK